MSRALVAGALLTIGVTALLAGWLGRAAILPAAVAGCLATAIELASLRALRTGLAARATPEFFKGIAVGMAYRLAGVAVFAGLVLWDGERFLPLATGLGYVGVLIPLLFLEVRFVR